jgi:tetratricopeptide (TPR) repeat protein
LQHLDTDTLRRLASGETPEELAEARSHLEACAQCALESVRVGSSAEPTALLTSPGTVAEAPSPVTALPRGASVGRYLVLHPVGEGGMGVVYAAYDPELDRKVALKLLLAASQPGQGHGQGQSRLLREAQAMARLSHPNVTAVHDVGVLGEQVFVAMDLVEGGNLRTWLQQPRPWREVLRVLLQAGRGLAAAHAAGLVHRDFKPDNVLVGRDGRVQVTDFGLARLAGEAEEAPPADAFPEAARRLHSPLTQVGTVVGTAAYMAPEQHRGQPPDARSDQFSFCVTLYLALYGRRPFDSQQMAQAARQGTGREPSTRTPFNSRLAVRGAPASLILPPPRSPRVPGWLKRALMRGLALHPEDRFPSMEALLERLSGPPAAMRHARAAGLAALLVGAGAMTWHTVEQRQDALCSGAAPQLRGVWDDEVARRVEQSFSASGRPYAAPSYAAVKGLLDGYAQSWVGMHTEACQATRLRGEQPESVLTLRMVCLERRLKHLGSLTTVLAQPDSPVDKAVDAAQALPALAACADTGALLAVDPLPQDAAVRQQVLQLQARLAEVQALRTAGRFKQALPLAQQAVSDARPLSWRPVLAEALYQLGEVQSQLTDLKASEESLSEAFWLAESTRQDDLKVDAASQLLQVVMKFHQGRFEVSELWSRMAQSSLDRLGDDLQRETSLRLRQAGVLCRAGRCAEAQAPLERILARVEREQGPYSLQRSYVLASLARIYALQPGQLPRARQALEQVVEILDRVRGPGHPGTTLFQLSLAETLSLMGEHALARPIGERSVAQIKQAYGAESMMAAGAEDTLGRVLQKAGAFQDALEHHQRSLALREKSYGPRHATLRLSLVELGRTHLALGRPAEALALLERARALPSSEPKPMADGAFLLAQALVSTGGDSSRAQALATEAREGFVKLQQPTDVEAVERWLREGASLGHRDR